MESFRLYSHFCACLSKVQYCNNHSYASSRLRVKLFSASESWNASNEKNTIALNDCMFTYAQVDCQECWRKELQVRKAFGDINTANVLYFAKKAEQSNSRTVELALVQCVIGAKIRPQKHQRRSEKKRIGDPLKGNSSRFVYLEDFDLNFFMFSNLHCRVPL